MARRRKSATGHEPDKLQPEQGRAAADTRVYGPPHSFSRAQVWLANRFEATYLVALGLIIGGAVIFFAAKDLSWLQGAGGVIVGTGFTVLITTITSRRAIHEQYAREANLRRKDDLYGPLYAELKNLREIVQKACDEGGPYPQRFGIGNSEFPENPMTLPGYKVPTLVQWPAFKQGYYWSDFTESARQVLDRLIDRAEAYNRAASAVSDPTIEVLASEIEQAIHQVKASGKFIEWHKKYPSDASWYEATSQGKAEPSWFRRLVQTPPAGTTLAQVWAHSWITAWPIQQEPATLAFLLAGDATSAARVIHTGFLPGNDPSPPLPWIVGIFQQTIPRLKDYRSYREARVALERLYECVREAEQMVLHALNDIQRRYEGGRPPL